jgi:hypothetical protein
MNGWPTRPHWMRSRTGGLPVLANLKSLLETGDVLPQVPWEMQPLNSG